MRTGIYQMDGQAQAAAAQECLSQIGQLVGRLSQTRILGADTEMAQVYAGLQGMEQEMQAIISGAPQTTAMVPASYAMAPAVAYSVTPGTEMSGPYHVLPIHDRALTEEEFDTYFERGYNETEDYEEWERYTQTLGKEAPESFQEFQKIKYDAPDTYADLEGFYQYKTQNPSSGREFYEAEKIHTRLLKTGEIRATGVIVAPEQNIKIISPNAHAAERLAERGITIGEAQSIVGNAVFALRQWNGKLYTFYSRNGFASVDTAGVLRTVGYLDEAGMKLFDEVVRKIERNS